jgi:drug/metabolite transporter (DMT)-like permease
MNMKRRLSHLAYGALTFLPASLFAADSSACDGAQAVGGTCSGQGFTDRLGAIINVVFVIIGTLAVIVLLYGAIRYITSTGDPKRIQAAKDTIIYAITGLVIAILARIIVGFVIGKIG